jgi:hypothetical protein
VAVGIPAVLLLMGHSVTTLRQYFKDSLSKSSPTWGWITTAVSICVILAYLVPLVTSRLKADYSIYPWNGLYDYSIFREKMMALSHSEGEKIILNVGDNKTIQAMFYTGFPAYDFIPQRKKLQELIRLGRKPIVILDERGRNFNQIQLLKDEIKNQKIELISIPRPKKTLSNHPYYN